MGCCDAPGLMPIEEAMDKMLSRIKPIQTTLSLPLADALGFVLAEDVYRQFTYRLLTTQQWTVMQSVFKI